MGSLSGIHQKLKPAPVELLLTPNALIRMLVEDDPNLAKPAFPLSVGINHSPEHLEQVRVLLGLINDYLIRVQAKKGNRIAADKLVVIRAFKVIVFPVTS